MHSDKLPSLPSALLLALHLSEDECTTRDLAFLVEQPVDNVFDALCALEQGRHISHATANIEKKEGVLWRCGTVSPVTLDEAALLGRQCPENTIAHKFSQLYGCPKLSDCEDVTNFMDKNIKNGEPGILLCLGLLIKALLRWGAAHQHEKDLQHWRFVELVVAVQGMCIFSEKYLLLVHKLTPYARTVAINSGNVRFQPIVGIFRCYMQAFAPQELIYEDQETIDAFDALKDFTDQDMQVMLPAFEGLLHYVRGEYHETLQCYERRSELQHWLYKYCFIAFSMGASQSAMYLRQYSFCIGINESARHNAEQAGETLLYLLWRSIFCFVLLRKGDFEEALGHIDFLVNNTAPEANHKIFASTLRALALYHFLHDRIAAAHHVLRNGTLLAMAKGVPHSTFRDPLILSILYAFEERGFPPIPHYELSETIAHILKLPNAQLRATALRIQAMRRHRQEGYSPAVTALLHESLHLAKRSHDPAEISLATHALANSLEEKDKAQAHELRLRVMEQTGFYMDAGTPHRVAVILATCGPVSLPGIPLPSTQNVVPSATPRRHSVQERCHRACNSIPANGSMTDILHRLLNIAQVELACERALLLCADAKGTLQCVAAVHMSAEEFNSPEVRECRQWIQKQAATKANFAQTRLPSGKTGLCLRLEVGDKKRWILYLHNMATEGGLAAMPPYVLEELARLFAAEVRSALRMQTLREETSLRLWEGTTDQGGKESRDMPPVIGDGLFPVYEQARRVSVTDAPALILGETGVGKEIIARHIHQFSGRKGPFVPVHLASTQEMLFESELFGYERGAFTGAYKQKIGLFEVAHEGTMFIDEVGDIPPNIQTKLLRVLQEQRFIRVGGTREIHTNFRLIAATHKDLWQEVREGRFRQDLLYRISVVPLHIPPLRERSQDILKLAHAFTTHFSLRYGRSPLPLTVKQERQLLAYHWPGNVRELKNVVEQAVILGNSHSLEFRLPASSENGESCSPEMESSMMADFPTLPELEARYLRHVLAATNGQVRGPRGAEALLKMKRSTLYAKLRKYGISGA